MTTVDIAHIRAALEAVGDPGGTGLAFRHGTLHVTLPSVGAAMVFASALTARLIDCDTRCPTVQAAEDTALEVMARASNTWDGGTEGGLVVFFPGVTIAGGPAPAPAQCQASSWRAQPQAPYGPGGYNRCVRDELPPHRQHTDGFGQVFVLAPAFKVLSRPAPGGAR